MNIHKNARLTPLGRERIVRMAADGRSAATIAAAVGVGLKTVHKWIARFAAEGVAGLADRSSRPHRLHRPTCEDKVEQVIALRRQRLTDEGRHIYEIIAPAIAAARLAATAVAQRDHRVAGRVVISATAALAQHLIAPRLAAITVAYPEVQIELRLSEQRMDIVGEGIDLAVRMGTLEDSSLIARRLCTVRRFLVASSRYLAAAGTPLMPADLAAHRAIVTSPALNVWHLAGNWNCKVGWTIAAGNMLVAHELVRLDQGIALLPDFLVSDDLRSGALVTVLDDHVDDRANAWIVTSPQRYRSASVKAVIEHLAGFSEE